jgi:hypothetical protein
MMKHLNMKLPSSRPKKTTEPPVPQEPPSRNTPQILRNLSLADLVVIAKQQDHEISELDSKISSYTERRYVDAEEDMRDIDVQSLGYTTPVHLAEVLVSFYILRNRPFYPDGNVPLDQTSAKSYMQRICSGFQFKQLLHTSSLIGLVDAFSYCALFAYGTKGLRRFDIAEIFLIRSERILKALVFNNMISSPPTVIKFLTILPWYLVPLIALGHTDLLREAIGIEQHLVLPHKMSISATALSGVYGNIAYMTRDVHLKMRWLRAIDQLPSGSIPPYYDSYRIQLLASEVVTNEDGLHHWDALRDTPPAEPELTYRTAVLEHIHVALAKLPVYPTYLFRNVEELKRGIEAGFSGAQAITLALLGRSSEAEPHAVSVVTTIQLGDIEWVNIVLAFSVLSAAQVLIHRKRSDLYVATFTLLNALIPEVPRVVRGIHKLLERLKAIGTPFAEILKQQCGLDEVDFFTNWKFHSTEGPNRRFIARAVSLDPHAPTPTHSTMLSASTSLGAATVLPNGAPPHDPQQCQKVLLQMDAALKSEQMPAPSRPTDTSGQQIGKADRRLQHADTEAAATLANVSSASSAPSTPFAVHPPPYAKNSALIASSSQKPTTPVTGLPPFMPAIFPTPGRPVIPPSPYFTYNPATAYGSMDFSIHTPLAALSSWQNSMMLSNPYSAHEDHAFLGPFIHQSPLAEPPHPLTLLGHPKPNQGNGSHPSS